MIKNFFSRFFDGNDPFNSLPHALISSEGELISTNQLFKRYITNEIGTRLKDIMDIKTVDNQIIGYRNGCGWNIIYKHSGRNQYKIWAVPEMQDAPSIWSVIKTPMLFIDLDGEIKYANESATEKLQNLRVGDFLSKYCPAFDKKIFVEESTCELLLNENLCRLRLYSKNPKLWLVVIEDMADLDRIDYDLKEPNRLKSIGQITSSVAHDFRNILAVIDGYCELIVDENNEIITKGYVEQIHRTVQNASNMVKELLRFTRAGASDEVSCCPAEIINELKSVIGKLLGRSIQVGFDVKDDIARVGLSRTDLERIITNIILNAKDSMFEFGSLQIRLTKKYFTQSWKINDCYLRPGFYLVLTAQDTGCGISPENQEKILTPFFTTKPTGNGLGLSTILSMLREISGGLQVFSAVGKGTTVTVYMPIVQHIERNTPQVALDALSNTKVNKKSTIILVEDNEDVLKICAIVLDKEGYNVHQYSNAEDAIKLSPNMATLDLLITDANLPGMSGAELLKHLGKKCKINNVLVISGYDESILKDKFPRGAHFLSKPIPLSDFRQKVHNILMVNK